jgi:hypothetical protein
VRENEAALCGECGDVDCSGFGSCWYWDSDARNYNECIEKQNACLAPVNYEGMSCSLHCQGRELPNTGNVGRPELPPDGSPGCGFSP